MKKNVKHSRPSPEEKKAIAKLVKEHGTVHRKDIAQGVLFARRVWSKGAEAFVDFCAKSYVPPGKKKQELLKIVDENLNALFGYFGVMGKRLRIGSDLNDRPLLPVDMLFAGFTPSSHLSQDMFEEGIAAFIQLNFGTDSTESPRTREGWAMRRIARVGRERVPAKLVARGGVLGAEVDNFVSNFNIPVDRICFPDSTVTFPKNTLLKSHWGLRDSMTALNGTPNALPKQRALRDLMRRVVDGEIPRQILNNADAAWDIKAGVVINGGKREKVRHTGALRWEKFRSLFNLQCQVDPHLTYGNLIDQMFKHYREMEERGVVMMIRKALSSPCAKGVGAYIEKFLGRPLEAHDIYFKNFMPVTKKASGKKASKLFSDAGALQEAIPSILISLGWPKARAEFIGSKIRVHNGRSAGHAMGPCTEDDVQYLRVPAIPGKISDENVETFMHELGHAVEQVLTMYGMDYKCLTGVPNTAFTEAFAFTFQAKTPMVLGRKVESDLDVEPLVRFWELYEIGGPALVEIEFFHWLYNNKNATAEQMHRKIRSIGDAVWRKYYANVLGRDGEGLLSVYSHILWCSFYLADYFIGYVIASQVRKHLRGKSLAKEMERICSVGSIYPNDWMRHAVGAEVSIEPLLTDVKISLSRLSKEGR